MFKTNIILSFRNDLVKLDLHHINEKKNKLTLLNHQETSYSLKIRLINSCK